MITVHAACALNGVIGQDGALPWHLPADLAQFRAATLGTTLIMGRATFESIGRPLPLRRNVVLSRNPAYRPEGVIVARSLRAALDLCGGEAASVIGGQAVFEEALPLAHVLRVTLVHAVPDGDRFFPRIGGGWRVADVTFAAATLETPAASFMTLVRA